MKKVILWKSFNPNNLFGGYNWHIDKVWDRWDDIYSEPYYVEIPDDFYISENRLGISRFFKNGCITSYDLTIGNTRKENSSPYLIGGEPVESVKLKVIGEVNNKE